MSTREQDRARIERSVQRKHSTSGNEGPDNGDRATWAHKALEAFALQTGQIEECAEYASNWSDDCLGEVAGDLIANLFHLARINDVDPNSLIERALYHFEAEVEEEEEDEEGPDEPTYRVFRIYQDETFASENLASGLTEAEAQAWCKDPQTSSTTATTPEAVRRTLQCGAWFEGYTKEEGRS